MLIFAGCNTGTGLAVVDNSTTMPVSIEQPGDDITGAVLVLDYAHHEIHEGSSFFISTHKDLVRVVNNDFVFTSPTSPDKWAHMVFDIGVNFETIITIFENATFNQSTCSGVLFSENRNRNYYNGAETIFYEGCTVIDDGHSLGEIRVGSSKAFGGDTRGLSEIILKHNTTYILRFYTTEIGTYATGLANWYEHTNN